ncbi:MAG: short-chain dehydrogenase [Gordonia sp.]|nr:short-chain dehydrogenase [Gordonia sp. (in: high G+C Gram-positive bacteria)]
MADTAVKTLSGRVALVTGATSGIGRAIAIALAANGATVLAAGRSRSRGLKVVEQIQMSGGHAEFLHADLMTSARELAETATRNETGRVDILVNNAALLTWPSVTHEVDDDVVDAALAVNVKAPFILTGILADAMARRGSGVVINIGSVNAQTGLAGSALYSMTKAAIQSLTMSWAAEYGRSGVRVNAIAPGPTDTENNLQNAPHFESILATTASGRLSRVSEIGAAAVFLAGESASNIHGVTLTVDGGYSAVSRVYPARGINC